MDYIIILCFIVTIIYCWRMDKKVSSLSNAKNELYNIVRNFDDAIVRSEICIHELKNISSKSADDLQQKLESANHVIQDLSFLTDRASEISEKLEVISMKSAISLRNLHVTLPKNRETIKDNKLENTSNSIKIDFGKDGKDFDKILDRISEIKKQKESLHANDDERYKPKISNQSSYFSSLRRINT